LQQVTHPPDVDCLSALQPPNRDGVARRHRDAQVWPKPLGSRSHHCPTLATGGDGHERRAGHGGRIIDLDQQSVRTTTEDATEVGGTLLCNSSASWILRARGQHHNRHSWPKSALKRLRPRPLIVDIERRRHQAKRGKEVEERRKRRILYGYVVACARLFAQQTLDGIQAAARDRDRTVGDPFSRELGRRKRDEPRQLERPPIETAVRIHTSQRAPYRWKKCRVGIAGCEIDESASVTAVADRRRLSVSVATQRRTTAAAPKRQAS